MCKHGIVQHVRYFRPNHETTSVQWDAPEQGVEGADALQPQPPALHFRAHGAVHAASVSKALVNY